MAIIQSPIDSTRVLKSFLKNRCPSVKVDAFHLYLKVAEHIGYKTYKAISRRIWLSEFIYGALLFPERKMEIEKFLHRLFEGEKGFNSVEFNTHVAQVEKISNSLITSMDWSRYRLAGFTLCICQLTSSLYFIRRIKQIHPDLPVVLGGTSFTGVLATGFLKTFK